MRNFSLYAAGKKLLFAVLLFLSALISHSTKAAGVTIITHGFENSGYPTWISAMADEMPTYFHYRYPNLNTKITTYRLTLSYNGSSYISSSSRTNGSSPFA